MQIEYAQDSSVDMTTEQLDVMWSHFRVLDSERKHFEKPPSTWKPPDVRDMTDEELSAYWNGFREIMQAASMSAASDSNSANVPAALDSAPSATPVKPPAAIVTRRITGKKRPPPPPQEKRSGKKRPPPDQDGPSMDQIVEKVESDTEGQKGKENRKGKGRGKGRPRKEKKDKDTGIMKRKVSRTGKGDSVSIWKKVQLFKESHLC